MHNHLFDKIMLIMRNKLATQDVELNDDLKIISTIKLNEDT
jgi:hypothetical protein